MIKRAIEELLNLETGLFVYSSDLFSGSEESIFKLRRKLAEDFKSHKNSLICAICHQPVYIAGNRQGTFFFKHRHEKGDCPIKTKGMFSQEEINRMKYNGVKESQKHIQLKDFIYQYLSIDSRCKNIQQEKVVKSKIGLKEWKKPDVSCEFQNNKLVFEIQLSTTFLNVIVDRENFYQNEGIFIAWVFNQFNPDKLRFTEKDIYYANKYNALVVNADTIKRSEETGELIFLCYYKAPKIQGNEIVYSWKNRYVTMSDLCFDQSSHKVFYHDFDRAKLSVNFERYWIKRMDCCKDERIEKDKYYCELFSIQCFSLDLTRILDGLYSAKNGFPVGFKYGMLQIANLILTYSKKYGLIFLWALEIYGSKELVLSADHKKTFDKKKKELQRGLKSKDTQYKQDHQYDYIFLILFPDLRHKLEIL